MFSWLKRLFASGPSALATPAGLPTATLFGVEYQIATSFSQLRAALSEGKRVMFRYNCTKHIDAMRKLQQSMGEAFGDNSPEKDAVLASPLVCPRCTTLFPDKWKVEAVMAAMGGGSSACPACGGNEALLVLVIYRPEDISEADVAALRAYWRSKRQEPEAIESKLENALEKLKKNPHYYGMMELWLARNFVAQKRAEKGVKSS